VVAVDRLWEHIPLVELMVVENKRCGEWWIGKAKADATLGQKEWDKPFKAITEQELSSLRAQANELFGNEKVWFEIPRCISWDKVDNPSPQSTPQVLPSFEVYTPPMTYLEEVEETLGTQMEVEPLDQTKIEDVGLDICNQGIPLSSREVSSFDEPKPQLQSLPNYPSLDESLREERGHDPPTKRHSLDSLQMKQACRDKLDSVLMFGSRLQVVTIQSAYGFFSSARFQGILSARSKFLCAVSVDVWSAQGVFGNKVKGVSTRVSCVHACCLYFLQQN
ncbi:hypothetical protein Tco_1101059, partial [Tanacetum coccineum]